MIYSQLPNTYKYDTLAEAIYSREVEYFHYDFDKKNFEEMLATLPDGDYKNQIQDRLNSTITQMNAVKAIYDALHAQIDDQQAYEDAVVRAIARRATS